MKCMVTISCHHQHTIFALTYALMVILMHMLFATTTEEVMAQYAWPSEPQEVSAITSQHLSPNAQLFLYDPEASLQPSFSLAMAVSVGAVATRLPQPVLVLTGKAHKILGTFAVLGALMTGYYYGILSRSQNEDQILSVLKVEWPLSIPSQNAREGSWLSQYFSSSLHHSTHPTDNNHPPPPQAGLLLDESSEDHEHHSVTQHLPTLQELEDAFLYDAEAKDIVDTMESIHNLGFVNLELAGKRYFVMSDFYHTLASDDEKYTFLSLISEGYHSPQLQRYIQRSHRTHQSPYDLAIKDRVYENFKKHMLASWHGQYAGIQDISLQDAPQFKPWLGGYNIVKTPNGVAQYHLEIDRTPSTAIIQSTPIWLYEDLEKIMATGDVHEGNILIKLFNQHQFTEKQEMSSRYYELWRIFAAAYQDHNHGPSYYSTEAHIHAIISHVNRTFSVHPHLRPLMRQIFWSTVLNIHNYSLEEMAVNHDPRHAELYELHGFRLIAPHQVPSRHWRPHQPTEPSVRLVPRIRGRMEAIKVLAEAKNGVGEYKDYKFLDVQLLSLMRATLVAELRHTVQAVLHPEASVYSPQKRHHQIMTKIQNTWTYWKKQITE